MFTLINVFACSFLISLKFLLLILTSDLSRSLKHDVIKQ